MQPADELPTLEPIHDSLELIDPPGHPVLFWSGAIASVLLLAWALWFGIRWLRRRRHAQRTSPERLAFERLWRIEPDAVRARELFREVHSILTEYLTARAGFAAARRTSPEILSSFHAAGFGESQDLRAFLSDSDRARFSAPTEGASVDRQEPIRQCRAIIDHVEAQRKVGRRRNAV
jgi:hypothetical protein